MAEFGNSFFKKKTLNMKKDESILFNISSETDLVKIVIKRIQKTRIKQLKIQWNFILHF